MPRTLSALWVWCSLVPALSANELTLSNDRLRLVIDLRPGTPRTEMRDRMTGEVYHAADFGVIRAWDSTEDRMRTRLIGPGNEPYACDVKIEKENDTHAVLHVSTGPGSPSAMGTLSFGVAFDIDLTLKGDTLEYAIPIASLKEKLPERFRLMNIELFPHLGATPAGSPGYLVIPSWSGALYYFHRGHARANAQFARPSYGYLGAEPGLRARWGFRPDAPAEYGSMMYGSQSAWEDQLQQPVYGTIRDKAGLAGILLSGEYDTELRARRNQGPANACSINPIWHYRRFWHSKLDPVDRRVRLIALDATNASYAGIANLFRDYLIRERGVKTLRQRAAENPDVAYFLDATYLRVMMGMKRFQLDGKGEMRSFQSWDDVADSMPLFRDFEKIQFVFVGANFGGHDGAHPTVFPLEPAHGGEAGFRRAIQAINDAGYRATFHLNYKDTYQCSPDWCPPCIQVNEYGQMRLHGAWIGGYSYQAIPQEMLERFGKRDLPKLRELGLRGMHYWDACLSVMEETFPPGRVITRREYGEGALAYFKYAAEVFGTVGCETSIAPLLGTVVNVGNTGYLFDGGPGVFAGNGFSENALIDHWVPLEQMIYHGLCCYGGGAEIAGRTGYEFNAKPTAAELAKIAEKVREHRRWGGDLDFAFITDHRMVAPSVTCTTLSDGTRIWVNKGTQEWKDEAGAIEPKGFRISRPSR